MTQNFIWRNGMINEPNREKRKLIGLSWGKLWLHVPNLVDYRLLTLCSLLDCIEIAKWPLNSDFNYITVTWPTRLLLRFYQPLCCTGAQLVLTFVWVLMVYSIEIFAENTQKAQKMLISIITLPSLLGTALVLVGPRPQQSWAWLYHCTCI